MHSARDVCLLRKKDGASSRRSDTKKTEGKNRNAGGGRGGGGRAFLRGCFPRAAQSRERNADVGGKGILLITL
jgi:hypothetical protein